MAKNYFAAETAVTPARSQAQIRDLLVKHGAEGFMIGEVGGDGLIQFRINGLPIQLMVPTPPLRPRDRAGRVVHISRQKVAQEKETRQRWRIVRLIIQAKLEAIALETTTVEREFLADVVMPTGKTIGETLGPRIVQAVESGSLPPLLPEGPKG